MVFSDTTYLNGLVQSFEAKTNLGYGTVSGGVAPYILLKECARFSNNANRIIWSWIYDSCQSWQYDDNNYTDLPIALDDLVAGQRTYLLPVAAQTIRKIQIQNDSSQWYDIYPTQEDIVDDVNIDDGQPMSYWAVNDTIRLNVAPSYSRTDALRVFFDRDVVDWNWDDFGQQPGFATQFHDAIAVGASIEWLKNNQPGSPSLQELKLEWADYERRIRRFYNKRHRDHKTVLRRMFERWR